jgi:RNAse (barnase) inhibitor barstar
MPAGDFSEVAVLGGMPFMNQDSERLRIDLRSVRSKEELHVLLEEALHFPDYYGRNWDAFDECIRNVELPRQIEIIGLGAMAARLPREAKLMRECIADFVDETAHDITIQTA